MSTEQSNRAGTDTISETDVESYLRSHPDFFRDHDELLSVLSIPHPVAPAVSLIERQVAVLRDQNEHLRRKLDEFIQVARENAALQDWVQQVTLSLMECTGSQDVLRVVSDRLQSDFDTDALTLLLFENIGDDTAPDTVRFVAADDPELARFENFFKSGRPLVGRLKPAQLEYLFGATAEELQSAALVPIGEHAAAGLVAIGSREAERFHPGLDTQVLAFMGMLIHRALKPHLASRAARAPS